MDKRQNLQKLLEEIFESTNVYYQPPASVKMNYPAIVYSKANIAQQTANDKTYLRRYSYELTVIDKKPDNPVIEKLLDLPHCRFNRHYVADGLNHDVLTLYY